MVVDVAGRRLLLLIIVVYYDKHVILAAIVCGELGPVPVGHAACVLGKHATSGAVQACVRMLLEHDWCWCGCGSRTTTRTSSTCPTSVVPG
jgi:hypothetical protein